ncbi:MAG: multidrug efflux SMR transporter [Candidatus Sericytochromatia bacterium]
MFLSWLFLILAIMFEVAGTIAMKLSEGFTKLTPSILLFIFYAISFAFVTISLKKIDMSITYAVWSGLGTAMITIIGIYYFKEPATIMKFASIGLIILGLIGLNAGGNSH